jgi:pseudaminic acid biosynthesis-associated methylase
MEKKYQTDQEAFWAGQFGMEYTDRNSDARSVAKRTAVFARILSRTRNVRSVLECGTNIGHNLAAIKNLIPECSFGGIEINDKAASVAEQIPDTKVFRGSILEFTPEELGQYDMTITSGVLIHIEPSHLPDIYKILYECSLKYILVKEYYNPTPVEVPYRGHSERLFKRDFAGEILDLYPSIEIVDYGFQYHRDYNFPADDSTWFLLKK